MKKDGAKRLSDAHAVISDRSWPIKPIFIDNHVCIDLLITWIG